MDNNNQLEALVRINAGGGTYTDINGNLWSADQYFSGGKTYSTSKAIANTEDKPLYQTARWSKDLSYDIPLANGEYTVNLKFAENWATDSNMRVFDVFAEDKQIFNNFDIYAETGGKNIALNKSFQVKVTDGKLNLDFNAEKNNSQLSALEIFSVNSDSSDSQTPLVDDSATPLVEPGSVTSEAIKVGFENHATGTKYNKAAQSKDWEVIGSKDQDAWMNRSVITDSEAYSGEHSLRISYLPSERSGGSAVWNLPSENVYYLSYRVKFADDFDFDGPKKSGGKLPGLGARDEAGDLCSGGNTCTGDNGFSSRYMWRDNGRAELYLYHMDKPDKYGERWYFEGSDGSEKYFERGKWHHLVQRVKINDGNQANGEVDVWMDGEQVLSIDELQFVDNNQGIDSLYFSTFHGGSGSDWLPEKEVYSYFDDFVISTNAADVGL